MPASLWSGNLRLSLVLIPVKLFSAVTEEKVSFRQIHAPSGTPIRYVKGVVGDEGFEEVPEEEIIKGYEHSKGHHVLIRPEEIEDLKLEAKHTIDMMRFVDEADIDSRYFEKPYYLLPDGDDADEGYVVIRKALAQTGKVAIGQLVMHGREHLVGIKAHGKGLMLSILRHANELRDPKPYFESITVEPATDAVALAVELIEKQSGPFKPETMPDEFAAAVREVVQAKVEQREPAVMVEEPGKPAPAVINIMAALKQSVQAKGRAKVQAAVRKRMGKAATPKARGGRSAELGTGSRRTAH
jgi:DNA end-binding protein Ku